MPSSEKTKKKKLKFILGICNEKKYVKKRNWIWICKFVMVIIEGSRRARQTWGSGVQGQGVPFIFVKNVTPPIHQLILVVFTLLQDPKKVIKYIFLIIYTLQVFGFPLCPLHCLPLYNLVPKKIMITLFVYCLGLGNKVPRLFFHVTVRLFIFI